MSAAPQLTPYRFKPGQSGNPSGRSARARSADILRKAKYVEFVEILVKLSDMQREKLKAWLQRPEATNLEVIYGTLVEQATQGDKIARQEFSDRLFGKVKELEIESDDEVERKAIEQMSTPELIQLVKEKIPELKNAAVPEGEQPKA